ncbi:MAG TPA: Rid family hydrolase [Gemmatimonadaceae bacterium]|nr:Rid family hydrolase [Gemmatimonadaceae bacterium]
MRRLLLLLPAVAIVAGCAPKRASSVEFVTRPGAPGPFSEAVRVDNLVFLSGVLGTDSTGKLVPGGIGPETRQALENVKAALQRQGLGMDRVVKCTVMLADIGEWAAMNEVYRTYFPGAKPARSAFGTTGLALGGRLELECFAAAR